MATVIMALLYVLEGAILTVTAVVTGIKHSEFPASFFDHLKHKLRAFLQSQKNYLNYFLFHFH